MAETLVGLLKEIAATYLDMAPYLLLGLAFAGILHIMFKKEFVLKHLGGGTVSSSIKAALLGVPLPLCSCGVLPTALSLRRNKASESATMSFLISTPQTGIDSIIATYGMLGPVFALFRPLAAFAMGIIGGVATGWAGKRKQAKLSAQDSAFSCVMCEDPDPHDHSIVEKIRTMIKYAFGDFLDDIAKNLIIGIVISGVISYFLPDDFFARYIGNQWGEMLIMIVGGIPLYVCATASIPIAAVLMMKGLSPGAAFVFLAVGPATNAASIMLIGNTLGKKFVTLYLAVISISAIAAGLTLNAVYSFEAVPSHLLHIHDHAPGLVSWSGLWSAVLAVMLILSLYRLYIAPKLGLAKIHKHQTQNAQSTTTLYVEGMTCNHCAANVRDALLHVPNVTNAAIDIGERTAILEGTFDIEEAKKAISEAGYKVISDKSGS